MFRWSRRQPLDMGLAEIHPVPLRRRRGISATIEIDRIPGGGVGYGSRPPSRNRRSGHLIPAERVSSAVGAVLLHVLLPVELHIERAPGQTAIRA